jgi:methionine sulfoxide reductase heme-binding subunit
MTAAAVASGEHLFWLTSRAAGIVALLASSASVGLGLLMAGRMLRRRGLDLRSLHEALSLAAMAAIVVHAGALVFDDYVDLSAAGVTIPLLGDYRPLWTSLGIACGWALIALGLSYYWRARIGVARWRALHRWTALVWVLSIAHALGEGTDAGRLWFLASVGIVIVPAAVLLALRHAPPTPTPTQR